MGVRCIGIMVSDHKSCGIVEETQIMQQPAELSTSTTMIPTTSDIPAAVSISASTEVPHRQLLVQSAHSQPTSIYYMKQFRPCSDEAFQQTEQDGN